MGLTVTAYSHATLVGGHDDCMEPAHIQVDVSPGHDTDVTDGACYDVKDAKKFEFDVSYAAHVNFVKWLSGLTSQSAFTELLACSDNEDSIGPQSARRLRDDLNAYAGRVSAEGNDTFTALYERWRAAAVIAADTGLIRLH